MGDSDSSFFTLFYLVGVLYILLLIDSFMTAESSDSRILLLVFCNPGNLFAVSKFKKTVIVETLCMVQRIRSLPQLLILPKVFTSTN